ncbi:hypothetical protein DH2020_025051 [Rehmannia glutinosa]|uniref:Protodermal factor 1 n=1 Tax=Rehmannia glutinosa TaxID=99300 RepID=A0ABR0W0T6_REHGL
MERKRSKQASLSVFLWAALVMTATSAVNFEDEKNYYIPDPHANPPPTVSYTPPTHGSGGGGHTSTPTVPSHGGGSSHGGNCGYPPSGGQHHSTPTPHTPTIVSPPTTVTPPTTPITVPGTPAITVPSPPFPFDPNSPPFTCTYWRNHPALIWGLFGWFGTVGNAFGVSSLPGIGAHMNLLQALSNTRTDGLGELYREGTAALLNSVAHTKFPYTTTQVKDSFVAALGSNKAAAAQAQLFKLANEGKIKPRA